MHVPIAEACPLTGAALTNRHDPKETLPEGLFDVTSQDFFTDPYKAYDRFRNNHNELDTVAVGHFRTPYRVATTYEVCHAILKNSDLFRHPQKNFEQDPIDTGAMRPFPHFAERIIVNTDGKQHATLRDILDPWFSREAVAKMEQDLQMRVQALLKNHLVPGNSFDFFSEVARPFPFQVIASLLGCEGEEATEVQRWAEGLGNGIVPFVGPSEFRKIHKSVCPFSQFADGLLGNPEPGTLTEALATSVSGGAISRKQAVANIMFLIIAGHETTASLISNTLGLLLSHPGQKEQLMNDRSLISSAVREALRFEPPVHSTWRVASIDGVLKTKDREFEIKEGERFLILIGAASRDSTRFENPNTPDITRKQNLGIWFGSGPHTCVGAPLAIPEAVAALESYYDSLRNLRLDPRKTNIMGFNGSLRGPRALHVIYD